MEVVQFINLTEWSITIINNDGARILDDLKPAKSKKSLIIISDPDSSSSSSNSVHVLKDGYFANVRITQTDLTKYPIVVFKSEEGEYGGKVLILDGLHANKYIDAAALKIMSVGRRMGKIWWCRGKRITTKFIALEAESIYEPETCSLATLTKLVSCSSFVDVKHAERAAH